MVCVLLDVGLFWLLAAGYWYVRTFHEIHTSKSETIELRTNLDLDLDLEIELGPL